MTTPEQSTRAVMQAVAYLRDLARTREDSYLDLIVKHLPTEREAGTAMLIARSLDHYEPDCWRIKAEAMKAIEEIVGDEVRVMEEQRG